MSMKLPKKVLIANRGEIAVRVMKTCKKLGVATVAVHSDADARSLHVTLADEAISLPGNAASDTYLRHELILDAAKKTGADAIHPGYGFLSENAEFARAVKAAGIAFVGPPAEAIELLGDKITSKQTADKAGTPTVPGDNNAVASADDAKSIAARIGYPVLLKPAAGGGGKGMRIVHGDDEVADALSACQAEALKGFGDDRIFVEKFITKPRHIEIQVLADSHGNILYLNERECSIQRRYQKVIEEAPSPVLTPALRKEMGESAVALARTAGYVNAGTVEFILDEDNSFYFLEMNTRLQVEHPVTELITGLDLVERQLRVAAGEALDISQEDIGIEGWAIEARICAENPARGFAPSAGSIVRYNEPRGAGIRVDSGVRAGSSIGVFYDSMLAKLIAYGKDRDEARARLSDALNAYEIEGPSTNISFANSILNHPSFISGDMSTNFIAENYDEGEPKLPPPADVLHAIVTSAVLVQHNRRALVAESLLPMTSSMGGVRSHDSERYYVVRADEDVFRVSVSRLGQENMWRVDIDGTAYDVETPPFEFYQRRLKLEINGKRQRFLLNYEDSFIGVRHSGVTRTCEIYSPREWELAQFMPALDDGAAAGEVECPMPGVVISVEVEAGDTVHAGDRLLTLESMKMQTGVAAPCDGTVAEVHVEATQTVGAGDVLIEIKP